MSRNRGLIQADASIDVTWDEFMLGINVTGTSMLFVYRVGEGETDDGVLPWLLSTICM